MKVCIVYFWFALLGIFTFVAMHVLDPDWRRAWRHRRESKRRRRYGLSERPAANRRR